MSLLVEQRVVAVQMLFHGTPSECQEKITLLGKLVKTFVRLVVTENELTQHAVGFIAERPAIARVSDRTFRAGLVLAFPDPLKYAGRGESLDDWETATGFWADEVFGGLLFPLGDQTPRDDVTVSASEPVLLFTEGGMTNSVTCENVGQADSWPILEATGPFDWCQWVCDGQVVRWESPVAAGDTLRINTHSGEITVGDFPGYATSLALDEFFPLPPGDSVVAFQASHPSRYRVRWLSAWM